MLLEREKAQRLVESLFDSPPGSLATLFEAPTWTLAIVEELKVEDLPKGRLMWVLGNGMPLRPDFSIMVNEDRVVSKLAKKAEVEWDLGTRDVVDSVQNHWRDRVKGDQISPIIGTGKEKGLDPSVPDRAIPYIEFTNLGKVWGTIRLI